jgi:hypothetical protein
MTSYSVTIERPPNCSNPEPKIQPCTDCVGEMTAFGHLRSMISADVMCGSCQESAGDEEPTYIPLSSAGGSIKAEVGPFKTLGRITEIETKNCGYGCVWRNDS